MGALLVLTGCIISGVAIGLPAARFVSSLIADIGRVQYHGKL